MKSKPNIVVIGEIQYLRFYEPFAKQLALRGLEPVWLTVDGRSDWPFLGIDSFPLIDTLLNKEVRGFSDINWNELSTFESTAFEQPERFAKAYVYTTNIVRNKENALKLARAWYRLTLGIIQHFQPKAIFVWNGRYLPYRAVLEACKATGQKVFTNEIAWIPGTIFIDRGPLNGATSDLKGADWTSTDALSESDKQRAESFLKDYTKQRATMVNQGTSPPPTELRQQVLGSHSKHLIFYGCQVDWDTNVVIGARRFKTNVDAVKFLLFCIEDIPEAFIVVKTHPLDTEDQSQIIRNALGKRGVVVDSIHAHTLIEAADVAVVRNSTVGFEAICYKKPVVLLEHSKYSHPKLTYLANTEIEGKNLFKHLLNEPNLLPDPEYLCRFIVHLLDQYLIPVSYEYFYGKTTLGLLAHLDRNRVLDQLADELLNSTGCITKTTDLEAYHAVKHAKMFRHGENAPEKLLLKVRRYASALRRRVWPAKH